MQLALSTPSVPPFVPVWAELSENLRQGFTTQNQPWNLGPNVVNSTSAIGFWASLFLDGVRQSDRARYYNPTIGRFISEDPMGFAGSGPDLYAYAVDDPIDFNDPFGLDKNAPNSANQSSWQQKMRQASHYICGTSPGDRVAKSVLTGAGIGAVTGGIGGFVAGEVFGGEVTLGATGFLGAYLGAHVGAAVGAVNGLGQGAVLAGICYAGFQYDN
jgi:RHS repeat-associated protein